MAGSSILASEYAGLLCPLLVLQLLFLAGLVAAIEFRLELLVGCFARAPLGLNFACSYTNE